MKYAILLFALVFTPAAIASTWYVDANVVGGAIDGSSWTDAFIDLQPALAAADSLDEIWIAAGTYLPTSGTDRFVSFEIPGGASVYGGFAGGEVALTDRDWLVNLTVLSGDIGAANSATDNSYNVVRMGPRTKLDGLRIQHGYADGPSSEYRRGAGIYNISDDVTIRFCRVSQNESFFGTGAGLYTFGNNVLVEDCDFQFNYTYGTPGFTGYGGGASARYGDLALTVFRRVVFRDNVAEESGGGLWGGTLAEDCNFLNNQSNGDGGGSDAVYNVSNSYYEGNSCAGVGGGASHGVLIQDSEFTGNSARVGGGVSGSNQYNRCLIHGNSAESGGGVQISIWNIYNSVIFDNIATDTGGGVLGSGGDVFNVTVVNNSAPVGGGLAFAMRVANSIVWGNQAPIDPSHHGTEFFGEADISTSLVEGSGGSGPGWSLVFANDDGGNIDADPLFANALMDDFHIGSSSPAFDTGADSLVIGGTDVEGNLRIQGAAVDMGAYESDAVVASPGVRPSVWLKGYPNPFNPEVTIEFSLASATHANLAIYDVAGRLVRTLWNGPVSGETKTSWDGRDDAGRRVGTGLYFARLATAESRETVKLVMVK